MKNRKLITLGLLTICLAGAVVFGSVAGAQEAKKPQENWSQLQVQVYPTGQIAFFDPESGKLYIYEPDGQLRGIATLQRLGEPLELSVRKKEDPN